MTSCWFAFTFLSSAHNEYMKLTCYLCVAMLVTLAIFGGIYAFTGFNALLFLCLNNQTVYRSLLAVTFVASLFTVYSLIVFKPFRGLK